MVLHPRMRSIILGEEVLHCIGILLPMWSIFIFAGRFFKLMKGHFWKLFYLYYLIPICLV